MTSRGAAGGPDQPGDGGPAARLRAIAQRALRNVPDAARRELGESFDRLRKVRSVKGAMAAFEEEAEHVFRVVVPVFVRYPAPVHGTHAARVLSGGAGMTAALVEQLGEAGVVLSRGLSAPASVPLALTAALASLAVESYLAASLRVHDLQAAGLAVDPGAVAADVATVMAGERARRRPRLTRRLVRAVGRRMLRREAGRLFPVLGIVYGAWGPQATMTAIRRLPLHPPDQGAPWPGPEREPDAPAGQDGRGGGPASADAAGRPG